MKKIIDFLIPIILSVCLGFVCTYALLSYIDMDVLIEKSLLELAFTILIFVLIIYAALFCQILLHEIGHLIFGLLSGYRFCSFRIFRWMWVYEDGKLKFCRFSLPGTAGQCLMVPGDLINGKIPVFLYNLGGPFMNLITAVFFYWVWRHIPFSFYLLLAIVGLFFFLMNGIPLHYGNINNDGYNAFSLRNDPDAIRAFWVQLKVNEQMVHGKRLKDMPEDWFTVPSDASMKNSMISVLGVYACNRYLDCLDFEKANALIEHLTSIDSKIIGLHKQALLCDRIYLALVYTHQMDVVDSLWTKEQVKFIKSMKNNPSILRTQYAYALLRKKDLEKADSLLNRFETTLSSYPYAGDIESEKELIAVVDQQWKTMKTLE